MRKYAVGMLGIVALDRPIGASSVVGIARLLLAVVVALTLWAGSATAQVPDHRIAGFEIYVNYGRLEGRADLWDALPGLIERIREQLGVPVLASGDIYVVADLNDYFRARGEPEQAPRWAQALAIPARRTILLRFPDPEPIATLTHELSHLAVYEAVDGHPVPRWFLEGFAMRQAEEWGGARSFSIAMAALFGNTLPFQTLERGFPPHWQSAGLAYAQSFHFVQRLIDTYGTQRLGAWLRAVSEGVPWADAFRTEYGVPVGTEYARWGESVRVWYAWVPALVSATTLFALMSLVLVWGRRSVGRRRSRRLAIMAAEEAELYPDDPDDRLFD